MFSFTNGSISAHKKLTNVIQTRKWNVYITRGTIFKAAEFVNFT